mgnify:CR=1 FL=1
MPVYQNSLIVCDPNILNSKPVIKGTRISVALILQNIASGMSKEDILRGYPTITREGLDFAARQFQGEEIKVFESNK